MKKINLNILVAAIALLVATGTTLYQDKDNSLAYAERVQGKYVFIMSEPVQEYEVVMDITPGAISLVEPEFDDQLESMINRASRKLKKKKKEWDAIITSDAIRGRAIKFK